MGLEDYLPLWMSRIIMRDRPCQYGEGEWHFENFRGHKSIHKVGKDDIILNRHVENFRKYYRSVMFYGTAKSSGDSSSDKCVGDSPKVPQEERKEYLHLLQQKFF